MPRPQRPRQRPSTTMRQSAFAILLRYLRRAFRRRFLSKTAPELAPSQANAPEQAPLAPPAKDASPVQPPDASLTAPPAQTALTAQTAEARLSRLEQRFLAKQDAREARAQLLRERDAAQHGTALAGTPAVQGRQQLELPFDNAETEKVPPDASSPAAPPTSPKRQDAPPTPCAPYRLPPTDLLLQEPPPAPEDEADIARQKNAIQNTLDSFLIDAEVTEHKRGPRITLFEVHVAAGVKVTAIANIANDLAMALAATSLRILAPMPGHDYVGIEVPNKVADIVRTGSAIRGKAFTEHRGLLPIILGRNVEGQDVVTDLAKAPHLLVAGATGSGKSVCLNNIIISLLYRFSPEELNFILVDPKVVEMSIYNAIPHLLIPVITDPDLVLLALRWVIDEMQRRYKLLAMVGVRNLESFNRRPPDTETLYDETGNPVPQRLPFLVVVIDELADIMLTAKQDVETCLARIAQLSRAVGIHCIVATQRPSVNVITGVIKANFPTRIAFQVSSQVDSRTIIDGKGAEALLGKGDMLFKSADAFRMRRIQGAMLTDKEIDDVVAACAEQGSHPDSFDLIKSTQNAPDNDNTADMDAEDPEDAMGESLIRAAIEIVIRDQKASISYIQRRLKIGYNKAASIIETLEKRGVVGPQLGTAPREIIAQSIEEAMQDEDY